MTIRFTNITIEQHQPGSVDITIPGCEYNRDLTRTQLEEAIRYQIDRFFPEEQEEPTQPKYRIGDRVRVHQNVLTDGYMQDGRACIDGMHFHDGEWLYDMLIEMVSGGRGAERRTNVREEHVSLTGVWDDGGFITLDHLDKRLRMVETAIHDTKRPDTPAARNAP